MGKHNDLDGTLLACTIACVRSMQAHGPLTQDQRERLGEIYDSLLTLSSEVAGVQISS